MWWPKAWVERERENATSCIPDPELCRNHLPAGLSSPSLGFLHPENLNGFHFSLANLCAVFPWEPLLCFLFTLKTIPFFQEASKINTLGVTN